MRRATLIKIALGLAAVGLFGVLFIRSVRNVGAEPYTMRRASLAGWTVALDAEASMSGVRLALWPPNTFAAPLFSQLFARSGLSLTGPNPVSMPLLLESEFVRLGGAVAPDALVQLARDAGLESQQPVPRCMATRRISEPGSTRDLFFIRFEHPAFDPFRRQVATRVAATQAGFAPEALTPFVIIAATDPNFASWLPLQGSASEDCLAPLTVQ